MNPLFLPMPNPPHIAADHLERREEHRGHELLLQLNITNRTLPCLDSLAVAGLLLARVFVPPQLVIHELAGIVDISFDDAPLRIAVVQVVDVDQKSGSEGRSEGGLEDRIVVENEERLRLVREMDFLTVISRTGDDKNGSDEAGQLVLLHVVRVLCN